MAGLRTPRRVRRRWAGSAAGNSSCCSPHTHTQVLLPGRGVHVSWKQKAPRAQTTDQTLKEWRSPQGAPARAFRTTPAPGRTCTPVSPGLGPGGPAPAVYRRLRGSGAGSGGGAGPSRCPDLALALALPRVSGSKRSRGPALGVCALLRRLHGPGADREHLHGDPRGGKQSGDWT